MQNPFHWLKDYFDMSRSERNGTVLLLAIIVLLIAGRYAVPYLLPEKSIDFSSIAGLSLKEKADKWQTADEEDKPFSLPDMEKEAPVTVNPFAFDPNTIDEAGLVKLGLEPKIVGHILKYRNKGGHFYKPDDLSRIYGLRQEVFNQLKPFIRIAEQQEAYTQNYPQRQEWKKPEPVIVELNSADSLALLNVKGIGPVFASRIIKFRNSLGGFYSIEQLKDVFGMDSAKYAGLAGQLKIDANAVHTININEATAEELFKHPYIHRWKLANAIVQYRNQHGPYKSVNELTNILIFKKEDLPKLAPYLRTD